MFANVYVGHETIKGVSRGEEETLGVTKSGIHNGFCVEGRTNRKEGTSLREEPGAKG